MVTIALGIASIAAWMGFEVVLRRPGAASSLRGSTADQGSTPLLVICYVLAAALPIVLAQIGVGTIGDAAWLGIALAALGLVLRPWAMRTLGASYSRNLRTDADQKLVTEGPYRWVRHPGYAGSLAVWVGATLAFHNWLATVAVAGLMTVAYGWRIRSEEQLLLERFGDAYRAYAVKTARLVPGVF